MQLIVLNFILHAHFRNINIHIYITSAGGHKLSWCVRAHVYRVNYLNMQSFNNEEYLLDILFTDEEIEMAIECILYLPGYKSHRSISQTSKIEHMTIFKNIFCSIAKFHAN